MLLLDNNSIYESRTGYPVYYQNNGYLPTTPPYSRWEHQSPTTEFTKSERELSSSPTTMSYQPFVYPQFPTPPQSVSAGSPSPTPCSISSPKQRPGDSFQIKRLLNLDDQETDYFPEGIDRPQKHTNHIAMRTSSVIMKIEDHRVFQVDSTTTASTDEDSSFEQPLYRSSSSGLESTAVLSSENLFICKWEKCYKVFCHLNELAGHVTQAHGTAPAGSVNYYCKWEGCPRTDRGFNARYKMLVHIRTHTKEKPHQCPECFKCFSRAENLKIHIRSHSGEKPYVCPVEGCNKAYSNSSDRFKHTRTHAMTKPYQCKVPGCNKRYTDPSSLRKHVKTYKHKTNALSTDEEALMQERITSTSDDIEENTAAEVFYSTVQNTCSGIDQHMTDLDLHERSPCCCQEKSPSYEERLKMYRLGALFNVNTAHCDVLVSSTGPDAGYSSYGKPILLKEPSDLDAPLDLSVRPK